MSVGTQRRITSTSCNSKAQEATRVSKPPLRSHATIAHKSHKSPSSPFLTIFDQIKHIESHWGGGVALGKPLLLLSLPAINFIQAKDWKARNPDEGSEASFLAFCFFLLCAAHSESQDVSGLFPPLFLVAAIAAASMTQPFTWCAN